MRRSFQLISSPVSLLQLSSMENMQGMAGLQNMQGMAGLQNMQSVDGLQNMQIVAICRACGAGNCIFFDFYDTMSLLMKQVRHIINALPWIFGFL